MLVALTSQIEIGFFFFYIYILLNSTLLGSYEFNYKNTTICGDPSSVCSATSSVRRDSKMAKHQGPAPGLQSRIEHLAPKGARTLVCEHGSRPKAALRQIYGPGLLESRRGTATQIDEPPAPRRGCHCVLTHWCSHTSVPTPTQGAPWRLRASAQARFGGAATPKSELPMLR